MSFEPIILASDRSHAAGDRRLHLTTADVIGSGQRGITEVVVPARHPGLAVDEDHEVDSTFGLRVRHDPTSNPAA